MENTNQDKIVVLYVDDEKNNLVSFKATFRTKFKVFTSTSATEALEILKSNQIHVLITDQRMPEITGTELLEQVVQIDDSPIRILLTGYTDMDTVVEAVNKGKIYHYHSKPWNEDELEDTIRKAYEVYLEKAKIVEMNKKLAKSNEQLEFILRQSMLD